MLSILKTLAEEWEEHKKLAALDEEENTEKEGDSDEAIPDQYATIHGQLHDIQKLFESIPTMSDEEKKSFLKAVMSNRLKKDREEKIKDYKELQMFKLKTWAAKIVILVVLFLSVLFVSVFLFISMRNGMLSDTNVVSSLLDTVKEVMKLIFIGN